MDISDFAEDYLVDHKDGMRKLTAWLLNEVMQQEALNQIQAQPYERTGKRRARRNGTRKRSLKTIHGDVILDKPQFREFPFKTQVFQSYSRVEMSLKVAIAESYLQGISTRKVEEVISKFGLENVSASEVSRIAKELDEKVREFLVPHQSMFSSISWVPSETFMLSFSQIKLWENSSGKGTRQAN
jgi:transposase-like protein